MSKLSALLFLLLAFCGTRSANAGETRTLLQGLTGSPFNSPGSGGAAAISTASARSTGGTATAVAAATSQVNHAPPPPRAPDATFP